MQHVYKNDYAEPKQINMYSGLKEAAYAEIKQRLLENRILPGERIREDQIADELKISRTPVREAINRLVAEGLVINIPRKGLFALEISTQEIEKMIEVRVALETLAVGLCCRDITAENLRELDAIFQRYETALRGQNYPEASKLDSEIHNYIARLSDNKKLVDYIRDLEELFTYARARNVKWTREMIDNSIQFHRNLIDAINSKDTELAKKAIAEDIHGMRALLD
ncbi:MAG: GntR family transcriptional regulator [Oscillospiraceae bacterium]|nr:GntR family transcriptional regulator [Oscillospiraceae bacterium]